jgi:hypothetical protein
MREVDIRHLASTVTGHGRRIGKLEEEHATLRADIETIDNQLRAAVAASHRAANAAIDAQASLSTMRTEMSEALSIQTREITRLLGNDRLHDEQMFQAFLDAATAHALKQIADETNRSGDRIGKRVTIPIGLIAAIATLVQWLMQHWR